MNQMRQEYHGILSTSHEGVITKTKLKGVKYFNSIGYNLLLKALSLTTDQEKNRKWLENIQNHINNSKSVGNCSLEE